MIEKQKMSWTATFLRLKDATIDTTGPKWWEVELLPLGTKAEIMSLLKNWFPDAHYTDPTWISVVSSYDVGEVLLSGNDLTTDLSQIMWMGFRHPSYRILRDVSKKIGWVVYDPSDGRLIDFDSLPVHYFRHEHPTLSKISTTLSADQVVGLRNDLAVALETRDTEKIAADYVTLSRLISEVEKNNEGLYWSVIDALLYIAHYQMLANWKITIPTEDEIRCLQAK